MIYTFADCRVDTASFEIRRDGQAVNAQPQVLELLIFLLENRARFVSRDEIFDSIWKDRIVSDTTLSSYIKSVRKLVGDDGRAQNIIRTVHGRGFQFVAEVEVADERGDDPASSARASASEPPLPVTRYAKSGDVHIAYQVFGEGPADLVIAPGFISHIENYWSNRELAQWLTGLGKFARVVIFDKRGTGLSDGVYPLPHLDERMDDVRAVMDAAGLDKAYILGVSEGGSLATLFAAMHPDRCLGLLLYGAFSSFGSWYASEEELQQLFDYAENFWGSGESLPGFAPSVAQDPEFKAWWGRFERMGANPGAVIALMRMNSEIDITDILPGIRTPALVMHRTDDVLIDVAAGRLLGEKIPGARYVELAGSDHLPWVGENSAGILAEITAFISDQKMAPIPDTILTTLLSVQLQPNDSASADESLASDARSGVNNLVSRFRGKLLQTESGTAVGSFDGPARAVHCACEIVGLMQRQPMRASCCVHTGEVSIRHDRVSGDTVAHLQAMGESGLEQAVIISATVKDLIAGAGLEIRPAGELRIADAGRPMRLYGAARKDG